MGGSRRRRSGSLSKGHGNKLGQYRERAISALLATTNLREAARKVGVHESTLRTWRADPEFKAHFEAAQEEYRSRTIGALVGLSLDAVETLRRNLRSKAPSAQQVRAALGVLENVIGKKVEHSGPGGAPLRGSEFVIKLVRPDDSEELAATVEADNDDEGHDAG